VSIARIGILGQSSGWHANRLVEAARERGHEAVAVDYQSLVGSFGLWPTKNESPAKTNSSKRHSQSLRASDIELLDFDRMIVRSVPAGSLEQVIFRVDALHRLEASGVRVLNPARAIESCVDKYLASARLHEAGLSIPRTIVCESAEDAMTAFERLGPRVILKPLFGAEGRGILLIDDKELAYRAARSLEQLRSVFFMQEYVPNPGYDLRVFLLGSKVVASMRRWTAPGEFRANVTQGGRAEPIELSREQVEIAIEAARATGAPMAGVDLLMADNGGIVVIEVNSSPGFRALERVTGVDVAGAVIEFAACGDW